MKSRISSVAVCIVFITLLTLIMFRINNYPNSFDSCVENAIHYQVEKVLDNRDISGIEAWKWTDMHQHGGGRSPIYGYIIESGIKIFGLSLLGVRFIEAFIGFLALILLYFTVKKYYSKEFSISFITILATSPWFLIMNRSGGIVGFSLILVMICICLITLSFYYKPKINEKHKLKNPYIFIPILAGLSIAILPYGHAITRIITVFILLWVIINPKGLGRVSYFLVIISALCIFSIQFQDVDNARKMFFNAKGENIISVSNDNKDQKEIFLKHKLLENTKLTVNYFLGLNDKKYFNTNIADSYWRTNVVLYPKFLVPFFIIGLLIYIVSLIKYKKTEYFITLSLFGITILPGLLSGHGNPNQARDYLSVLPLYFFISVGIEGIVKLITKIKYLNKNVIKHTLVVLIVLLTSVYQIHNFFAYEKGVSDELHTPYHDAYKYLNSYFVENPNAKVLVHGFPTFNEYGYVLFRWLGGNEFQKRLESGNIKYVQNDNTKYIEKLINNNYFDLVITTANDVLKDLYPTFKSKKAEQEQQVFIYRMNNKN